MNLLYMYSWDYKLQTWQISYNCLYINTVMREEVELFEWPSYDIQYQIKDVSKEAFNILSYWNSALVASMELNFLTTKTAKLVRWLQWHVTRLLLVSFLVLFTSQHPSSDQSDMLKSHDTQTGLSPEACSNNRGKKLLLDNVLTFETPFFFLYVSEGN